MPRFLDLPGCARPASIATSRGTFAVHIADPPESAGAGFGTAVLVPGFTGSKEDFIGILEPLARRGYRVVAIDPRGHYETPGPADEAGYAIDELADDLVALLDAVAKTGPGGPVHLVGHSLGGVMVRYAGTLRPDLIRSIALLCSGPAALSGRPVERVARQLAALEAFDLPTVAMLRELAGEGTDQPEHIRQFLRTRFVRNSKASLLAESRYLLGAPDLVDEQAAGLQAAGVPVLVAHGSTDDAWPIEHQRTMAKRLGATYTVIEGAGHSPAVDNPVTTADVLCDFWKRAELLTT